MQPHERALELLALARRDENAAHTLEANDDADYAVAGFHYQQAAEKLLKALLAERDVDFPRTHDLLRLKELVEDEGYRLPVTAEQLDALTPYAATFRYELAESDMARTERRCVR
jgi:HEPN domain-containing protein